LGRWVGELCSSLHAGWACFRAAEFETCLVGLEGQQDMVVDDELAGYRGWLGSEILYRQLVASRKKFPICLSLDHNSA